MPSILSSKNLTILYALLALVYVSGLFIPLMENDSAQHATMAMRMYLQNDFIHLYKGFNEYLDKPHMHFWLAGLSFKIFGISHWAYRIPALLFTLLGAYSSFGLAKELYGKMAGHIAALIFLSAQAVILANHDVRTDAVLTGASVFALWQLATYINKGNWQHAVLGSVGTAIAFSTKGLLGIFFIAIPIFCHILYTRSWKRLWSWKVILGLLAFFLAATPMLYAYYTQFDLHPDKVVNGQTNVSGLKFIFWDQSFNRITGSGFESNNTDYFFFFHTLLWAFLPWAFITYIAIFDRSRQFLKLRFKYQKGLEFLTVGGFWLTMIIINTSKSKLPHYMNSLFPVLAVLLAGYLVYLFKDDKIKQLKRLLTVQTVIIILATSLSMLLIFAVFPLPSTSLLIVYLALFSLLVYALIKKQEYLSKIVTVSVLFTVFLNFSLNTQFYPNLLEYQAGNNMVKLIEDQKIDVDDVYLFEDAHSWTLSFYTKRQTPEISIAEMKDLHGKWVFVYDRDIDKLKDNDIQWDESLEAEHYRITMLSLPFLNPNTRAEELKKAYLLKIH
jgi:4-amino-4-deoxy-L-arabinose transferase-like glycosyltransferase